MTRSRWTRLLLYVAGPLVVLAVVAYVYVSDLGHVSTDDAYVKADMVTITAEVSGKIVAVPVEENERVSTGDVLFRIEDTTYRAGLVRARAQLTAVRQHVQADKVAYRQKKEQLALARDNAAYAKRELTRINKLSRQHAASESDLDAARHDLTVARHKVKVLQSELAGILTRLSGDPNLPVAKHPDYIEALAAEKVAAAAVARCIVRAPFDGVASRTPDVGEYAATGQPIMSLVSDRHVWVRANFKETELTNVRPGQAATIHVDAYPGKTFDGVVESIAQATGAEFSVLPPQNATGNWVKVVQRIPLRIAIENRNTATPLRAGMSTSVDIDTASKPALQQARLDRPAAP